VSTRVYDSDEEVAKVEPVPAKVEPVPAKVEPAPAKVEPVAAVEESVAAPSAPKKKIVKKSST
jgi:DNA repair protein REV1